ncbi:MAG: hypothetical protein HY005_02040 [Candidatus Staskawiczbacteria bacterium]|nr:hypothetical protein [Candidatus Staskawiczbacteria bacterium]MBI3337385.1 hypothetical protein [Candidatus Staskawiczbacteria bacterium]
MADEKNMSAKEGEAIKPSGESLPSSQKIEFFGKGKKAPEKREPTREEFITKEALKREIDKMELEDSLKEEAVKKTKEIQALGEGEKIEHLLEIAKEKGIAFAVKVANQINDPYVLDNFHDILVREWVSYKQFLR